MFGDCVVFSESIFVRVSSPVGIFSNVVSIAASAIAVFIVAARPDEYPDCNRSNARYQNVLSGFQNLSLICFTVV